MSNRTCSYCWQIVHHTSKRMLSICVFARDTSRRYNNKNRDPTNLYYSINIIHTHTSRSCQSRQIGADKVIGPDGAGAVGEIVVSSLCCRGALLFVAVLPPATQCHHCCRYHDDHIMAHFLHTAFLHDYRCLALKISTLTENYSHYNIPSIIFRSG